MGYSIAFVSTASGRWSTGGSRGLGRSMALALADVGADIVITGRTQATLDATAGEIRALGRKAWTIDADMGVPAECEKACAAGDRGNGSDRHPHQQCRQPRSECADRRTSRSKLGSEWSTSI